MPRIPDPRSRRSSPSLAGTSRSGLLEPLRFAVESTEGYVLPPEGPGLGVDVDEAVARAHLWRGGRLHLEMDEAPPDPGAAPFGGG